MTKGKGWFKEKGFRKTNFEIELTVEGEKVVGRIFNEIAPNGREMPTATVSGTYKNGAIQVEKKYDGMLHSQIFYELKKTHPPNNFHGAFAVYGCPAWDFNCIHELANGEMHVTLDQPL